MDELEITLDSTTWERLIDITGGAAGPCFQCGACTAICPLGLVKGESISIRSLIRGAQLGFPSGNPDLWLCTACGHCEAYCPRGVALTEVIRGLRYLAWESRETPPGLPSVLWSLYWNNNPWTQPPSTRSHWAVDLDIPLFDPEQHEILLYVGCTSSYDRRAGMIGRALVQCLRAGGVSFGYLGDEEPCCGESALSLGHDPFFQETIQAAAECFAEKGVERLVTISPHCYDVFKNHWPTPSLGGAPSEGGAAPPERLHYTQYLAMLLDEGRLAFEGEVAGRITFQDPCFLARHNDEVEAPRRVLEAIPGLELVEMAHNREETLCCGGGGGRMWLETEAGERFAPLRVGEAVSTGASVLATACPFCVACLEEPLKALKGESLRVLDVAELAARALT